MLTEERSPAPIAMPVQGAIGLWGRSNREDDNTTSPWRQLSVGNDKSTRQSDNCQVEVTPPPLRGDNCQVEVSDQAHKVTIVSSE